MRGTRWTQLNTHQSLKCSLWGQRDHSYGLCRRGGSLTACSCALGVISGAIYIYTSSSIRTMPVWIHLLVNLSVGDYFDGSKVWESRSQVKADKGLEL